MLKHVPEINQTLKGLSVVLENQAPVVRFFLRNWPVTLLAGTALGTRLVQRYRKKELTAYNVVTDVGTIVGPIASLFLLVKLAQEVEEDDATNAEVVQAVHQLQDPSYQTPHASELPIVRQIA